MTRYRRVVVSRHGGPSVLHVVEDTLPEPQPGEADAIRLPLWPAHRGIPWTGVVLGEERRGPHGLRELKSLAYYRSWFRKPSWIETPFHSDS